MNIKKRQFEILSLRSAENVIKDSKSAISSNDISKMRMNYGKGKLPSIMSSKTFDIDKQQESIKRKSCVYKIVNNLLWEWYQNKLAMNILVNTTLLQEKAKEFALNEGYDNFPATVEWLKYFCKFYNIPLSEINGHPNIERTQFIRSRTDLEEMSKGFKQCDIYNMIDASLFYRTLHDKLDADSLDKLEHEKVNVSFLVSAIGEKELPLVIYNIESQPSLKNIDVSKLGVDWYVEKTNAMTPTIFTEWLQNFNEKMKISKRHILLLVENDSSYNCEAKLSNINVEYMSSKMSNELQHGIAHCFYLRYRRRLLKSLVSRLETNNNVMELVRKIKLRDAISWLKMAWDEVDASTIVRCFDMCGVENLLPLNVLSRDDKDVEIEIQTLLKAANVKITDNASPTTTSCDENNNYDDNKLREYEFYNPINCNWKYLAQSQSHKPKQLPNKSTERKLPDKPDVEFNITLEEALQNMTSLKNMALNSNSDLLYEYFSNAELEIENIIVEKIFSKK